MIEITDTDTTLTAINAEKNGLNYLTNFYPPAKDKQKQQELFCKEITDFDYQTAYTAFNVIINDPDRSSLIRKISLAQQGFSFMNQSSCYVENAELCNLFFLIYRGMLGAIIGDLSIRPNRRFVICKR